MMERYLTRRKHSRLTLTSEALAKPEMDEAINIADTNIPAVVRNMVDVLVTNLSVG